MPSVLLSDEDQSNEKGTHSPQWADTTVLSGDIAAAIGELKAKPGGEMQVHGSGALIRWLLANELVDEMNLVVCPWSSARSIVPMT